MMYAITLTQPWATLVAIGAKRIETRSWSTAYRGPIAIHAAAGLDPVGGERGLMTLCRGEPFRSALLQAGYLGTPGLPRGVVVATAQLVGVHRTGQGFNDEGAPVPGYIVAPRATWSGPRFVEVAGDELAFGDYSPGRFAWVLEGVLPLAQPVKARGALGLWRWYPAPGGAS